MLNGLLVTTMAVTTTSVETPTRARVSLSNFIDANPDVGTVYHSKAAIQAGDRNQPSPVAPPRGSKPPAAANRSEPEAPPS